MSRSFINYEKIKKLAFELSDQVPDIEDIEEEDDNLVVPHVFKTELMANILCDQGFISNANEFSTISEIFQNESLSNYEKKVGLKVKLQESIKENSLEYNYINNKHIIFTWGINHSIIDICTNYFGLKNSKLGFRVYFLEKGEKKISFITWLIDSKCSFGEFKLPGDISFFRASVLICSEQSEVFLLSSDRENFNN
jgi:hypothetical protein